MAQGMAAAGQSLVEEEKGESCDGVTQVSTMIMASVMSGMSSSITVFRMGQPMPTHCRPSAVSLLHPERSRYTRRRHPFPRWMDWRPFDVKWRQWARLR